MTLSAILVGTGMLASMFVCQAAPAEPPSVRFIVGGRDSLNATWPWQAGIMVRREGLVCGGTLIDYDTVLTAAHCVRGISIHRLTVVLGEYNREIPEGMEQYIGVHHVSSHPLYNNDFLGGYDIALLHLKNNATKTPGVRPIPALASVNQRFSNTDCYITGWGVVDQEAKEEEEEERAEYPCHTNAVPNEAFSLYIAPYIDITVGDAAILATRLQEATINIISNRKCNSKKFWDGIVKKTNVCAFYKNTAACEGDSGGPLVCKTKDEFVLLGTTSWGAMACQDYPTVFTKVSPFRRWIRDTRYDVTNAVLMSNRK